MALTAGKAQRSFSCSQTQIFKFTALFEAGATCEPTDIIQRMRGTCDGWRATMLETHLLSWLYSAAACSGLLPISTLAWLSLADTGRLSWPCWSGTDMLMAF